MPGDACWLSGFAYLWLGRHVIANFCHIGFWMFVVFLCLTTLAGWVVRSLGPFDADTAQRDGVAYGFSVRATMFGMCM